MDLYFTTLWHLLYCAPQHAKQYLDEKIKLYPERAVIYSPRGNELGEVVNKKIKEF